ncbi:HVO_0234 family beta-propeller protein [Halalkalicoccus jeotgali]|uniref:HVO-0234-like beta-propeller domain-containing protein n=1 Tax=Halalkalicoccus jeotgali (strain DSM 18796 / CECT 7217 / JCM 14584 / KCTC 4019 / B3) TaxID=795797 RepID=D8JA69_HALJB|nr:hypothetical protein [Halalkalicoccus jeotgali]ADJ14591.1 hypothetical protein HacjB3_06000 [Halalkalicoccus jeotgali B3]ELY39963.1 hypothetical protein C497_04382 [Halalkalicoccus jeotgali B3]
MSTAAEGGDEGFLTFYREYAHTGIHTITATALTAFGLLTFVHRGFVVLAIAVYVLPPIYLYLTRDGDAPEPVGGDGETGEATGSNRSAANGPAVTNASTDAEATASDVDEERPDRDTGPTAEGTPGTTTAARSAPAGAGSGSPPDGALETGPGSATESVGEDDGTLDDESDPVDDPAATGRGGAEPTGGTGGGSEAESEPTGPDAIGDESHERDDDGPASTDGITEADETGADESEPDEWVEADAPTDGALFDAVVADERAFAVGEGGVLLARPPGSEWEAALENGPGAASETLRGVDATTDGGAIWVAGDGGALGRYDPATARHTDHSAPEGITDNWSGLAVVGAADEERVALVNGSGQVLLGEYDGSEVEWAEPVKPGSGSSMSAIAFLDGSLGYCCDTNAGVYRLQGEEFEHIGIEDASGFDALAATDETVVVANDSGVVQRFDGSVWTPVRVSEDAVTGLATDDEEWIAVGPEGTIHENRDGDWESVDSPTASDLFAVAAGALSVAVGEDGTVLERAR